MTHWQSSAVPSSVHMRSPSAWYQRSDRGALQKNDRELRRTALPDAPGLRQRRNGGDARHPRRPLPRWPVHGRSGPARTCRRRVRAPRSRRRLVRGLPVASSRALTARAHSRALERVRRPRPQGASIATSTETPRRRARVRPAPGQANQDGRSMSDRPTCAAARSPFGARSPPPRTGPGQ